VIPKPVFKKTIETLINKQKEREWIFEKNTTYQPGLADGNQKINRKETKSMKRTLLIIAALMLATSMVWADAITGPSPVLHPVTITVTIPSRLGISIPALEHNWLLDLTGNPLYPPAVLTPFSITNNATVQLLSNNAYTYGYTASMTTTLTTLTVGDFQYDATGWVPVIWVPGVWQNFGAAGTFENGAAATAGWVNRNMMYRVNLDGTEVSGTGVMTIVHTITQP
jgi:hypothetical protein